MRATNLIIIILCRYYKDPDSSHISNPSSELLTISDWYGPMSSCNASFWALRAAPP